MDPDKLAKSKAYSGPTFGPAYTLHIQSKIQGLNFRLVVNVLSRSSNNQGPGSLKNVLKTLRSVKRRRKWDPFAETPFSEATHGETRDHRR